MCKIWKPSNHVETEVSVELEISYTCAYEEFNHNTFLPWPDSYFKTVANKSLLHSKMDFAKHIWKAQKNIGKG